VDARTVSAAPQSAQNLLSGGLSAPQAVQRTGSGVPHWPQNFLPSGLAAPQLGHSMPHLTYETWSRYHIGRPPVIRMPELGQTPPFDDIGEWAAMGQ
jgi:hypothetical protein